MEAPISGKSSCSNFAVSCSRSSASGYFTVDELFTRLLAKYSMFDSAQQIFAYLLSKIEQDFSDGLKGRTSLLEHRYDKV